MDDRLTVQQLKALIRLSEFVARCHLDKVILQTHVRMAVDLLKTSTVSVESSEVDLSDFEDKDEIAEPQNEDMAQPEINDAGPPPENQGDDQDQGNETRHKKLVITEEFQRITHALVMCLRQHEEVMQDGIGLAGMKQKDLLTCYTDEQNKQGKYQSTEEVKEEAKRLKPL